MATRSLLDELAQQAEEGSARLQEMLSVGLGFLRTELGLDLGLEPKRYPGWVILVGMGTLGLLLLFLLGYGWAAACAGARKKRRSPPRKREEAAAAPGPASDDLGVLKNLRSEEQKKKNRKKLPEKPKSKKNKKKSKSDAKAVQNSSRHDGKEVDEGAWETKISHREKRQQRKRDKVQSDSGSLDSTIPGIENTITVTTEQVTTASFPVGSKKNKGDSHLNVQVSNFKSGKGDSTLQVSSGLNENLTVNGGGWNEKSVKLSSQISAGEEKWNSVSPASAGKRKTEPSAWGQDSGDANANGKDWGRSWSDRSIFSGIGSTAEPVSQSTTSDYQWDVSRNQPCIDDEWSGLNGMSSADPSSDWNAPAEEWGNWVGEERASLQKSQEPIPDDQKVSDDDKEKGEGALPTGKSKKKKKKKKKQGEDNSPAQDTEELEKEIREELPVNTSKVRAKQEKAFSSKTISTSDPAEALIRNSQPIKTLPPAISTEPSVILSKSDSDKSSSQVPPMLQETDKSKSNTKQNSVPPSQTKSETSWESPKQIKKKKKARRET
uniref:Metadherin n=1 Tax=Balaenoptera musculus TaxID=9771 RepID=A0A8C0DFQ7_BALMU